MKTSFNNTIVKDNLSTFTYMNNNDNQSEANPFKTGSANEVWKDLLKRSKPVSRVVAQQKMKEVLELQKSKSQY